MEMMSRRAASTKTRIETINFDINMWNIDYLVAPIVDYDGE